MKNKIQQKSSSQNLIFRLAHCKLQIAYYKLPIANCLLTIVYCLLLLANCQFIQAQSNSPQQPVTMSLDSVINIAMQNNPILQSAQLSVVQQQKLRKTAWDLGKTGVFYENEDLIKGERDSKEILKIGLTQTIEFPTTYFAQNKFNKQSVKVAQTSFTLAQKEILRDVRSGYFKLWLAVERQRLFQQQDSIFTEFANASDLRFKTGETNRLEFISAQAKQKDIQLALQSVNADILIAQQEIMRLLNYTQPILPTNGSIQKLQVQIQNNQLSPASHPLLNLFQQKVALTNYQRKVELNRLLPNFSARYFNQNWYGTSPGYYGYSFSIGIPLFFWGQQGKIQGAKLHQQIAQKDFEAATLQFNTGYNMAVQELNKQQQLLAYYEGVGVQYADEILNSAQLAFKNGEIGYIEYIVLFAQSIDIKNNYLSAITNYNEAIIQINYYINQ